MKISLAILTCSSLITSSLGGHSYTGTVKFQAYRHGMTCANYVGDCKPKKVPWDDCIKDPRNVINAGDASLAHSGILESRYVGKMLDSDGTTTSEPDIIFTSNMMSPIETALELFPGKTVYPAPYIMDTNENNKPLDVGEQLEFIRNEFGNKTDLIDFGFIDKAMEPYDVKTCRPEDEDDYVNSPRCTGDFDQFKKWFLDNILALNSDYPIPDHLAKKIKNNDNIHVAISGHGTQMRYQIVRVPKKYPLPPNIGFHADYYIWEEDEDEHYLVRKDDDDDARWHHIHSTKDIDVEVCEGDQNQYDTIYRCIDRNREQFDVILARFDKPKGKCPKKDKFLSANGLSINGGKNENSANSINYFVNLFAPVVIGTFMSSLM